MLSTVKSTENREELLNNALEAAKTYRNGFYRLDLTEEVYTLMGSEFHSDSAYNYQDACVDLLSTLADPNLANQIKNRMGDHSYGNLIEMLVKMRTFCKIMEDEAYEALLDIYRLENYPDGLATDALEGMRKKYAIKAEQQKKLTAA